MHRQQRLSSLQTRRNKHFLTAMTDFGNFGMERCVIFALKFIQWIYLIQIGER